ncbi:ParM/StbA family protein [Clostridium cuniculi]|uniref:ParM/StbA family protein n=1 Tax=Clostridium cuniculi TaxID=2548455 RepID=UPI001054479A|nr:ParM/StbA family protein [Clostridium cuniculi]
MSSNIQVIGLDCGRGYTKGYSEVNGIIKECCFKSIIGEGRNIELSGYKKPIMIKYDNEEWFVGMLAEKESQTPVRNSKDSKISETVQILMATALSSLAIEDRVKIMLAVPYKSFRKTILSEIVETYKGKIIKVKDMVNGGYKEVKISDISICREADAALYWQLRDREMISTPVGIANIGFRSTELTYFDKELMFIDKKSETIEFGNGSIMNNVKDKLLNEGIIKSVNEIDSSNEYDELKEKAYRIATENIEQTIEEKWVNLDEMEIYIAGGTALNMKFEERFKVVEDAQMATAKGCWLVGTQKF